MDTGEHVLLHNRTSFFSRCLVAGIAALAVAAAVFFGAFLNAPEAYADTIETIDNPLGSTMTLFDYWVTDNVTDPDGPDWKAVWANQGINQNHALKFFTHSWDKGIYGRVNKDDWGGITPGNLNDSNGSYPRTGIVTRNLGYDGYPALAGTAETTLTDENGNNLGLSNNESLAYLFDPAYQHAGKASYTGANKLFQLDDDGYFVYDSSRTWAQFDTNTRTFTESTLPSDANHTFVAHSATEAGYYGFFPFDSTVAPGYHTNCNDFGNPTQHNHYFGLSFSAPFLQTPGGTVVNSNGETKPMTFEFSGDDDVWLYIDGVLVGDMGGTHSATNMTIDFSTGKVSITHAADTTLRALFEAAGADTSGFDGDTFADGTKHTFDLFYLERGNAASNLKIKYNLATSSSIFAHKSVEAGSNTVNPASGQFSYELRSYYDQTQYTAYTAKCGADGTIDFGYLQVNSNNVGDSYYYVMREQIPDGAVNNNDGTYTKDGVTYDGSIFVVKETVVEDSDGLLEIQKTWYKVKDPAMTVETLDSNYPGWFTSVDNPYFAGLWDTVEGTPEFTNRLDSGNDIRLSATKTLLRQQLTKGQFRFLLCDGDGNPIRKENGNRTTASNDANGNVSFKVPGFTPADFNYQDGTVTRVYTIKERLDDIKGTKVTNADGTITIGDITYDTGVVTATIVGTYDSSKFAAGSDPISYTITYSRDGQTVATTYSNGETVLAPNALGFTNRSALYGIMLTKTGRSADVSDTAESPLSGARFTVTANDGNTTTYYAADGVESAGEVELSTDDDGKLRVTGLHAGTYTITETGAPAGYQKPSGSMTLIIDNDGTATFVSYTGATFTIKSNGETGVFSVAMTDLKQPTLPEMGGPGLRLLQAAGVVALAAAVMIVARSRRLKSGEW